MTATKKKPMKVDRMALAKARLRDQSTAVRELMRYEPPAGVIPSSVKLADAMAQDSTDYNYINQQYTLADRPFFPGYAVLSMLAQRPEYRKMSETIAREMTRKWCKIVCTGDDKSERVAQLEQAMRKYHLQDLFRKMAEMDGFFGRGQLYIDLISSHIGSNAAADMDDDENELPLAILPGKINKGDLLEFRAIEPIWTYPGQYNSTQPLAKDFYRPRKWFVMGKTVHHTRLMTFISREVPDILKPAYNFSGLSLSQMAMEYVDNWLRTRNSVGDIVHSFSTSGLKTNLSATLAGGGDDESGQSEINNRADLFNLTRDNRGLLILDKDTEEFFQFNVPLSGLSDLQAQAQEQMASVSSIPLVFLLGITPQGLNASSEGEILVFETTIHAMQEMLFNRHLHKALEIIQLSEFGEIDQDIGFEWLPLREQTAKEVAEEDKLRSDTDAQLISVGALSPDDVRRRIAADPSSPYHGIDAIDDDDEDSE